MADGEYRVGAEVVQNSFKRFITNPEGHELTFRIDDLNNDFDYLSFDCPHNSKTKRISLGKLKYFSESPFDRIIFLDSDMEVVGNVDLLISNELNSKDYWACHVIGYELWYKDSMKAHNVKNEDIINGGLHIINKPLLTKEFEKRFKENLIPGQSFDGSEQGYIGQLLPKLGVEIGWLPLKYNHCCQDKLYADQPDVRIKHFTGVKPWRTEENTAWRK